MENWTFGSQAIFRGHGGQCTNKFWQGLCLKGIHTQDRQKTLRSKLIKNYVSRAEMIGDGLVDKELVAQT